MTDTDTLPPARSRRPLIIMLVVATLPVIGAYFAYFTGIGVPRDTVNAGHFINPALSVETLVGDTAWADFQREKKWRLLVPVSASCPDECQTNLYTSRQVHIRLAQNSDRLARYAIPLDALNQEQREHITADHPLLHFIDAPEADISAWLARLPADVGRYDFLLVDQEGRAMMAYDAAIHGNEVLKDLKRALKYSIDYQ